MLSPFLWERAFVEIAPNRGALTKDVTDNTLDGLSLEQVQSLILRISAGTYRFTQVRRVHTSKPDGKKFRPLGVPTPDDKLVQGVLKLLLEAIYSPTPSTQPEVRPPISDLLVMVRNMGEAPSLLNCVRI